MLWGLFALKNNKFEGENYELSTTSKRRRIMISELANDISVTATRASNQHEVLGKVRTITPKI
jgi:hypothetical protein